MNSYDSAPAGAIPSSNEPGQGIGGAPEQEVVFTMSDARRVWLTGFLVAPIIALLPGVQAVVLNLAKDRPADILLALGVQVTIWVAWAVLLPGIYAACVRWPLRWETLRRTWWLYLIAGLLAPAAHTLIVAAPIAWMRGWAAQGITVAQGFGYIYLNGAVNTTIQFALIVAVFQAMGAGRQAGERRANTARLSAQLLTAELRALRSQLEPHFLFNTLNAIAAHLRDEPDIAELMLERLSQLLRLVLEGGSAGEVPLDQELELVRNYLGIHEARYGGRLATEYTIGLGVGRAVVPSMVLQPLVENAVAHGVAANAGRSVIRITASAEHEMLVLGVWNSGSKISRTVNARQGIGLSNTQSRLSQLYGEDQDLSMRTVDNGMLVEVRLPLRRAAGPEASPLDVPSNMESTVL